MHFDPLISFSSEYKLGLTNFQFSVFLNEEELFTHHDQTYKVGTVGLRVTDIPTTFSELKIRKP